MRSGCRRTLVLLLMTSLPAFAQTPPKLEPLPAIPPPPPDMQPLDSALEPQVTIRKRENETVEEYRMGGKLYMIKVTPTHGVPYYLIDERGDGNFMRHDSLDSGVRAPMWVIKEF